MQNVLILFFLGFSVSWAGNNQDHLKELKKEFPYGLLTDDYGILSKQYLNINTVLLNQCRFLKRLSLFLPLLAMF